MSLPGIAWRCDGVSAIHALGECEAPHVLGLAWDASSTSCWQSQHVPVDSSTKPACLGRSSRDNQASRPHALVCTIKRHVSSASHRPCLQSSLSVPTCKETGNPFLCTMATCVRDACQGSGRVMMPCATETHAPHLAVMAPLASYAATISLAYAGTCLAALSFPQVRVTCR